MKKNKSNLLIPAAIIVILVLILGFVLLRDSIMDLFKANKNALVRIEGFPREVDSTKKVEKTRAIIRSEQEFKNLMKTLFDDENKVQMPQNDFERNDLYIVTTDLNDTKGFRLKVRSIIKDEVKNEFESILERQKPGKTCVYEETPNIALDIVKIEKNIQEITADRVDKIIDCE